MAKDRDDQPSQSDQDQQEPPDDQPSESLPEALGERIRALRRRQKLSLSELARLADISKGYLSQIERSRATRPSAITIFSIAEALGVSMAELFEGEEPPHRSISAFPDLPRGLRAFAEEADLPPVDVEMLAAIEYRGLQPNDKEDWRFLYESIRRSVGRS